MLAIGTSHVGSTLFLSGALAPEDVSKARAELEAHIKTLPGNSLQLDCSGLRSVGFLLVSLLLRGCAYARGVGKQLVLCEVPDDLQAIIVACGLSPLLLETS